ncbi:uncharacterized protein LOC126736663 isoform X1 [Anthonomus grandis grandis]|uniref:uncharacterized protein LOC126736663 isoform X1 n=1 Tax=Anthonomus grandis grandis TaxID=2921223 RepID=UPI0021658BCC|nr:uncharacterized protein LOC126736663 isoform X1 [Anthonomus grandis grandis]
MCNFVIGICVLFLFVQGGHGQITCYECNSYHDNNKTACLDPFYPDHISTRTCASNFVCTKVSYYTQGTFVTSRSCDQKTSNTCGDIENTMRDHYDDLSSYKCLACEKDLCNKGLTMSGSMAMALVSTVVFVTIF